MSVKENFKALHGDTQEFVERSVDNYRLLLVEHLSLLFGDIACGFVLLMLLFLASLILLVALLALLAPVTGLFFALLIAASLLAVVAAAVHLLKRRLFVDSAVKRLCRIFFANEEDEE